MRFGSLMLVVYLASCTVTVEDPLDGVAGATLGSDRDPASDGDMSGISAKRVCASGPTVKGIDVSYYNGSINWTTVANAGYGFAIVRVSDGANFQDPKFSQYYNGAQAAGMVRGAYQFFRPAQSTTAQANLMIAAIGTLGPGDLPPILDVEADGGLSPSTVAAHIRSWVDMVKSATGVNPIIYTGKYFWRDQVGGPSSFVTNPLWIAQYTTLCPDLPSPWSTWAFWQYKDTGKVSGITGDVDMDTFNGTLDELKALAGGGGGGGGGGSGGGTGTSCMSSTMGTDEPDGACVQAASDQQWYQCQGGAWVSVGSTASCSQTFGWCQSATLGRAVPPRTCVQAASDSVWYQCDGAHWTTPVDSVAATGPVGACSHSYPL